MGAPANQTVLELYRFMKAWLELISSGIDIVPARDADIGRPASPYISIRIKRRNENIGSTDERQMHIDGSITMRGPRRSSFQLYGHGSAAAAVIDSITASQFRPAVEALRESYGIEIENIGPALEVTEQDDSEYEPRGFIEITVNYHEVTELPAGTGVTAAQVFYDLVMSGESDLSDLDADVTVNVPAFSSAFGAGFSTPES